MARYSAARTAALAAAAFALWAGAVRAAPDPEMNENRAVLHGVFEPAFLNFFPYQRTYGDTFGDGNYGGGLRLGVRSPNLLARWFGHGTERYGELQFSGSAYYQRSQGSITTSGGNLTERIEAAPFDLGIAYHARYAEEQWIWPTIGIGPDVVLYRYESIFPSQPALEKKISGLKYGWHVESQLNLSLTQLEPYVMKSTAASRMRDVSLFGRARWRMVSNPDGGTPAGQSQPVEGISFTGWVIETGLSVEFH